MLKPISGITVTTDVEINMIDGEVYRYEDVYKLVRTENFVEVTIVDDVHIDNKVAKRVTVHCFPISRIDKYSDTATER